MDSYNLTTMDEFNLTGLSDLPEVHYSLFVVFAVIFQITLLGNGANLLAIGTEKKRRTPIYYFLASLSLLDILCPSTTIPKMLENLLTEKQSISFVGCALQLYFLLALTGVEVILLTVMSYDQYVAICLPLRYTIIIIKVCCAQLMAGCWAAVFLNSLLHKVFTFRLSFCKSHCINQYYCDIPQLVAISCSFTYVREMLILVVTNYLANVLSSPTSLITFISYIYIISTVLKMQSAQGKHKAFSVYDSHLLVVCLFYGTAIFTYLRPSSSQQFTARNRLISTLYVVINPMLNPIIYSLKKAEVKRALGKVLYHITCLLHT